MSAVASVVISFGADHAPYADDTVKGVTLSRLTDCIRALRRWLDLKGLCLNPENTESVVLSTLARQRVAERIDTIDTGTVHIKTSD